MPVHVYMSMHESNIHMRMPLSLYFRRISMPTPKAPHPPALLLQQLPSLGNALISVGKGGAASAGGHGQRLPQPQ